MNKLTFLSELNEGRVCSKPVTQLTPELAEVFALHLLDEDDAPQSVPVPAVKAQHSLRLADLISDRIGDDKSSLMLLRYSSRHPKLWNEIPPTRGISCLSLCLYRVAYNRSFPFIEATYPYAIKTQRKARNAPSRLWGA